LSARQSAEADARGVRATHGVVLRFRSDFGPGDRITYRGRNLEVVAAFMRAAYGKGYCDALTEDAPGALCADHGYRVPARNPQHAPADA
jgi:SPP1 family predicted phage head-tail adaptor